MGFITSVPVCISLSILSETTQAIHMTFGAVINLTRLHLFLKTELQNHFFQFFRGKWAIYNILFRCTLFAIVCKSSFYNFQNHITFCVGLRRLQKRDKFFWKNLIFLVIKFSYDYIKNRVLPLSRRGFWEMRRNL